MEMGHFDVDMYAPAPRPPSLTCLLDAPTLTQAYPYALVRVDLTLARDPPPRYLTMKLPVPQWLIPNRLIAWGLPPPQIES